MEYGLLDIQTREKSVAQTERNLKMREKEQEKVLAQVETQKAVIVGLEARIKELTASNRILQQLIEAGRDQPESSESDRSTRQPQMGNPPSDWELNRAQDEIRALRAELQQKDLEARLTERMREMEDRLRAQMTAIYSPSVHSVPNPWYPIPPPVPHFYQMPTHMPHMPHPSHGMPHSRPVHMPHSGHGTLNSRPVRTETDQHRQAPRHTTPEAAQQRQVHTHAPPTYNWRNQEKHLAERKDSSDTARQTESTNSASRSPTDQQQPCHNHTPTRNGTPDMRTDSQKIEPPERVSDTTTPLRPDQHPVTNLRG
jgi:hypothetical protein